MLNTLKNSKQEGYTHIGVFKMFFPPASGCNTVKKQYRCPAMIPKRSGIRGDPKMTSKASIAHGRQKAWGKKIRKGSYQTMKDIPHRAPVTDA